MKKKNNFEIEKKFLNLKLESNNKQINKIKGKIKKSQALNKKFLIDYHKITDKIFDLKINKNNLKKNTNHIYQKIQKILLLVKLRKEKNLENKFNKIINN